MTRLATLLAIAPVTAMAHTADMPHAHSNDPTLLMGLGMIIVLTALALVFKRRNG